MTPWKALFKVFNKSTALTHISQWFISRPSENVRKHKLFWHFLEEKDIDLKWINKLDIVLYVFKVNNNYTKMASIEVVAFPLLLKLSKIFMIFSMLIYFIFIDNLDQRFVSWVIMYTRKVIVKVNVWDWT